MVQENNNGYQGIDAEMLQQMAGGEGFADPFGDIFNASEQMTPKGLIREMLSGGETPEERYPRLRITPKDRQDFCDLAYEDEFIKNRGRPDTEKLLEMEQLMGIAEYGEARHEAVQMYTRIMTPFPGPASWQKAAQRAFRKKPREEGGV